VTLKTRVIMLKIQLCLHRINYILKYIQIEIFNNITVFTVFLRLLSKTIRNLNYSKDFTISLKACLH